MNKKILTINETRDAIYQDSDFNVEELERLSILASSFIKQRTNYDFSADETIHPLAKQCAILYVRMQYFNSEGYKPEYDYSLGINSLIIDLQDIARSKKNENQA